MSRLLETLIRTFLFEQAETLETKPRADDNVAPADMDRYLKILNTNVNDVSFADKQWWASNNYSKPIGRGGSLETTTLTTKRRASKQSVNKLLSNPSTSMDALNAYKLFDPSAAPEAAGGFSVKINFKNEREKLSLDGQRLADRFRHHGTGDNPRHLVRRLDGGQIRLEDPLAATFRQSHRVRDLDA
jgi:hypothetical protein